MHMHWMGKSEGEGETGGGVMTDGWIGYETMMRGDKTILCMYTNTCYSVCVGVNCHGSLSIASISIQHLRGLEKRKEKKGGRGGRLSKSSYIPRYIQLVTHNMHTIPRYLILYYIMPHYAMYTTHLYIHTHTYYMYTCIQ